MLESRYCIEKLEASKIICHLSSWYNFATECFCVEYETLAYL